MSIRNYTGNGWQGTKCEPYRDVKEIAKDIRADIKWNYPGFGFSVRIRRYTGGASIDCYITRLPYNPFSKEWQQWIRDGKEKQYHEFINEMYNTAYDPSNVERYYPRYCKRYVQMLDKLERIGNQYRYSDSDGQIDYFDTNFYWFVKLDWMYEKQILEEIKK
jgi:hypothetical protein